MKELFFDSDDPLDCFDNPNCFFNEEGIGLRREPGDPGYVPWSPDDPSPPVPLPRTGSQLKQTMTAEPDADSWPFDQPRNCATMTMRQILDGSESILLVSHDADDHGWQFIGSTDANTEDGRIVCLEHMVTRDPSILQLSDLPPGWQATRRSPKHRWQRSQQPPEDDDEL